MDTTVISRVMNMAKLILEQKTTVREIAKEVGYSKSTVHKDLTEKLPLLDKDLFEEVRDLLEYNKNIRHIRGGQSTKNKYATKKTQFDELQAQ